MVAAVLCDLHGRWRRGWSERLGEGFGLAGRLPPLPTLQVWLIRSRQARRMLRASVHNHWLGLAIFAGTVEGFCLTLDRRAD